MLKSIFSIIFLVGTLVSDAQQKYTISGTVKEKKSGEVLIGASVYFAERPAIGTISNAYGFYSLTAPAGTYTLIVSFGGYEQDSVKLVLNKDILQQVNMQVQNAGLQAVVISASKTGVNNLKSIMGTQKLSIEEIKN